VTTPDDDVVFARLMDRIRVQFSPGRIAVGVVERHATGISNRETMLLLGDNVAERIRTAMRQRNLMGTTERMQVVVRSVRGERVVITTLSRPQPKTTML